MTIILFLIDTSSSMNQRTYLGARPTLLDVAKDAVEKFLKARARDIASRGDRYMLLTFEEPPINIKAGWKETHSQFMSELKHLTANGVTNMGTALKNAFDLLNLNRMQSGIDMYGLGRAPYYLEPSMIIVITDGSSLTHQMGVQQTLELPMQNHVVPGSELTREPFRWDQRLFSLVLKLTGSPPSNDQSSSLQSSSNLNSLVIDHSPIGAMCAVTSGRSYSITTQRSIIQSIEALVQKVQSGVVIQFEKFGPDPPPLQDQSSNMNGSNGNGINNNSNGNGIINNQSDQQQQPLSGNNNNGGNINDNGAKTASLQNNPSSSINNNNQISNDWHSTRSLIYVRGTLQKNYPVGHWPIPEAYWPDPNLASLPPRTAHPIVKFTCATNEPHMMDALPFDKYELESSPLTQYILSRKQPHIAWQVYVQNSGRQPGELGAPFGYLKAATNLNCVNLFVLPYNYPILLPLLEEMMKKPQHQGKPMREWKQAFDDYLRSMPPYYGAPLKRAMVRMGVQAINLIPENLETSCFGYAVHTKLKNHKNEAKAQFDRLVLAIQHQPKNQNLDVVRVLQCGNSLRSQVESTSYNNMTCTGGPTPAFYYRYSTMKNELNEFSNYVVRVRDKTTSSTNESLRTKHTFRNPYDIDRKDLIDQIHLMRANFMQSPSRIKFKDEDQIHTLPVAQMGNYQDYLKRQPTPLREIESTPVRQHMFGNPFKIDKKGMMVDEADSLGLNDVGGNQAQKNKKSNPNQRRRGPLPKDFILLHQNSWTRAHSPTPSPGSTPQHVSSSGNSDTFAENNSDNNSSSDLNSSGSESSTSLENGNSSSINNIDNNTLNSLMLMNNNDTLKPCEEALELRSSIFKYIRGPGMNCAYVMKMISKLDGQTKKYIIEETIREAKRFKKVRLLHQLNLISRHG